MKTRMAAGGFTLSGVSHGVLMAGGARERRPAPVRPAPVRLRQCVCGSVFTKWPGRGNGLAAVVAAFADPGRIPGRWLPTLFLALPARRRGHRLSQVPSAGGRLVRLAIVLASCHKLAAWPV
jgi:hypothetical protein